MNESKEYPKLVPGNTIKCKNMQEACSLGTALRNAGFKYRILNSIITIMGDKEIANRHNVNSK